MNNIAAKEVLAMARTKVRKDLNNLTEICVKNYRKNIKTKTITRLHQFFKTHYRHKGDVVIIHPDGTIVIPADSTKAKQLFDTVIKDVVLDGVKEELEDRHNNRNDCIASEEIAGEFESSLIDNLISFLPDHGGELYAPSFDSEQRHQLIDAYEKSPYPIGTMCAIDKAPDAYVWKIVNNLGARLVIEHNQLNVQRVVKKDEILLLRDAKKTMTVINSDIQDTFHIPPRIIHRF